MADKVSSTQPRLQNIPHASPPPRCAEATALSAVFKSMTPPEMLEAILARNLAKYQDPLGPPLGKFLERKMTWQEIIDGAVLSGGEDLGFLKQ